MAHPAPIQKILGPLTDGAWTLAALSAATESGLVAALVAPIDVAALAARTGLDARGIERLLDVLAALELVTLDGDRAAPSEALAALAADPMGLLVLRDDLRRSLGQPRCMVDDARAGRLGSAWHHVDPELIEVQGTFARVHTRLLMVDGIVPTLDGLEARLAQPGARALDVGAGAGGNAIAFCEAWPALAVVGLEPWAPSFELGRRKVDAAGLAARIELRPDRVEDLRDEDAFDFIWLPQMFLDDRVLVDALRRCRSALRPDGWLLTAWICDDRPGLGPALGRLRDMVFGGDARGPDRIAAVLDRTGYRDARRMAFGDGGVGMLAARA